MDAAHARILSVLRKKGMSEEAITIWMNSPHKICGMQIPNGLVADGKAIELLKIIDEVDAATN